MSEYQYYEFAAIDRPLTPAEMSHLRAVSTRGEITPSSFVNHYTWGGLKADPIDWVRRYFDAFVHSADWGSCSLMLRVPSTTFDKAEIKPFLAKSIFFAESGKDGWVLGWSLDETENYDRFCADDGSGWMRRLIPLREELLRGDQRALYLGWLAAARSELEDDAREPEVPPGLSALSPPQQALVEFLEINVDLLAAAAHGSARISRMDIAQPDPTDAWLGGWRRNEMAAVLKLIAQGQGQIAERQVRSRYATWLKTQPRPVASTARRRSLAELRKLALGASGVRQRREARERVKQDAEDRQRREAQLRLLMDKVDHAWAVIETEVQRGSAMGYQYAVRALADLAEGYALTESRKTFDRALRRFLARHTTRGALFRRLAEAGLWA